MRWHDMTRCTPLLIVGAFLAIGSASAQQPAPPNPADDWSIETVTVTAQAKGPAYWHATKGQSEVWILGIVGILPKDFVWNQTHFSKLLDGTRLVLLPPRASASLFDAGWFLLTKRSLLYLPDGQTLDGVLGAPLAARFANARAVVHRDAAHYEGDALPVAALELEGDFLKAKAMTYDEPADTIDSLARHHNVDVHYIAKYDAMPSIEAILKSPPEAARACVEAAVNDVEFENVHAAAAADAWAVGDVAHAIEAALDGGGRTIAVVGIGQLLRKNGVLERLHADGIEVEGPPE
jgi:hypothetical protein